MTPGELAKVAMAEYLALPAVSASIIKAMVNECPRAAWWQSWLNPARERDTSDAMDAGTIAHEILLEGSQDCVSVIDPNDHPAEKTGAIPAGWTNKSIRAARDAAREAGKIPVLVEDMVTINAMVASAQAFIKSVKDTEPAIWQAFQPGGGDSELTIVWQDGATACRMRPDRISRDRKLIIDAKFTATSAEPDRWGRTQMVNMGYYVSAAFYRRGIEALYGVATDYCFLVVETAAPHLCSLVGVDPHGFALGGAKVASGLSQWASCAQSGNWPAYPARVCYPEIPPWEETRWQERQGGGEPGIPYDPAVLFGGDYAARVQEAAK